MTHVKGPLGVVPRPLARRSTVLIFRSDIRGPLGAPRPLAREEQ